MALPTLTKTWQFSVNNAQTAQGTALADNRLALFNIKTAMIGFGTNPWTVVSSSDSATAGNTDKWVTAANLVWATSPTARSWIVLKQTGIGSNFQVLIACQSASGAGANLLIQFSPSVGFTGGTITAVPTATDSATVLNSTAWTALAADAALRWSVMQSTDGQCTRVFVWSGGNLETYWMFEKLANPTGGTPGYSNTGWAFASQTISTLIGQTQQNAINCNTSISYEATSNIAIASEVSGAWDIFPVSLASVTTVGTRGRLGTLQDFYIASAGIAAGDTFPATGSPAAQFIVLTNISHVLPWNNGAFNLT